MGQRGNPENIPGTVIQKELRSLLWIRKSFLTSISFQLLKETPPDGEKFASLVEVSKYELCIGLFPIDQNII